MHRVLVLVLLFLVPAAPTVAACPSTSCVYLPIVAGPSTGSSVTVLPNHSSFIFGGGSFLRIVGEVKNETNSSIQHIHVSVRVLNGQQVVETSSTPVTLDVLTAGDKTCFNVVLGKPTAWTSYQIDVVDYQAASNPPPNLALFDIISSRYPIDTYRVIGRAQNGSDATVNLVEPIATLYNAAGTVLDCSYIDVNTVDLAPGQVSSFGMLFADRASYADVATFRVQVTGNVP